MKSINKARSNYQNRRTDQLAFPWSLGPGSVGSGLKTKNKKESSEKSKKKRNIVPLAPDELTGAPTSTMASPSPSSRHLRKWITYFSIWKLKKRVKWKKINANFKFKHLLLLLQKLHVTWVTSRWPRAEILSRKWAGIQTPNHEHFIKLRNYDSESFFVVFQFHSFWMSRVDFTLFFLLIRITTTVSISNRTEMELKKKLYLKITKLTSWGLFLTRKAASSPPCSSSTSSSEP